SVSTRRTMEQIAKQANASWSSDRTTPAKKKRTRSDNGNGASHRRAIPLPKNTDIQASTLTNAKRRAQPWDISPQLATLVRKVPEGDKWLHELKFDGYRIISMIEDGKVRLMTRRGNDWTHKFPTIA